MLRKSQRAPFACASVQQCHNVHRVQLSFGNCSRPHLLFTNISCKVAALQSITCIGPANPDRRMQGLSGAFHTGLIFLELQHIFLDYTVVSHPASSAFTRLIPPI